MLGSFKIKLVGTFLALSVVPLAAAFWGFSAVAERSVTSSVDDRLEAGLTRRSPRSRTSARPRLPLSAWRAIPPSRRRSPRVTAPQSNGSCPSRRRCGSRLPTASRPARAGERCRDDDLARRPGRPLGDDRGLGAADASARRPAPRPVGLSGPDELVFVDEDREVDAASIPRSPARRHLHQGGSSPPRSATASTARSELGSCPRAR